MTMYACFCNSLDNNNLAGETDYVKATEVQGDSKEVGAKVSYQGREMVVSKGIDSEGELKMRDFSGVTALAEALKLNKVLSSIRCAFYSQRSSSAPIDADVTLN